MHAALLLSLLPLALAVPAKRAQLAPLLKPRAPAEQLIADKYIVKFKEGTVSASVEDAVSILAEGADYNYGTVFKGFAGTLDASALDLLRAHPDVSRTEQQALQSRCLSPPHIVRSNPFSLGRVHRAGCRCEHQRVRHRERCSVGSWPYLAHRARQHRIHLRLHRRRGHLLVHHRHRC